MSQVSKLSLKHFKKGFTLIELLVVIAIIGVLASVVLASLNSARNKGQIAAIKSNLKNIIPQAELAYDTPGNYSTVCADTKVVSMLAAITNGSTYTSCYSYSTTGDVYLRYGASAIIGTSTPIQAYSVSGTGITTWDIKGVNSSGIFVDTDASMTWDQANTACGIAGGRLPTIEELKTLSDAMYVASGNTNHIPPNFSSGDYWSGNTVLSTPANAYVLYQTSGGINPNIIKTSSSKVRCVR